MQEDTNLSIYRTEAARTSAGGSSEEIYTAILERIDCLNLNGSVLDFGAGTGVLTRKLLAIENFSAVTAIDLVGYGRESDAELDLHIIKADLNEKLPLSDELFDVVVACEIIEHLENPRHVVREMHRLLKPGGQIVLSTPNNESWRSIISLVCRGHFIAFNDSCYPAHITALLQTDLRRILAEVGFERIQFAFSEHGAIPGFPVLSWQRVSLGCLKGMRFSDNVVCTAQRTR